MVSQAQVQSVGFLVPWGPPRIHLRQIPQICWFFYQQLDQVVRSDFFVPSLVRIIVFDIHPLQLLFDSIKCLLGEPTWVYRLSGRIANLSFLRIAYKKSCMMVDRNAFLPFFFSRPPTLLEGRGWRHPKHSWGHLCLPEEVALIFRRLCGRHLRNRDLGKRDD